MDLSLALEKPMGVRINLEGRVIELNLQEELTIDTTNILNEILEQPSKYALWATLFDLACAKMISMDIGDKRWSHTCDQFKMIGHMVRAFNHRKTALLKLWENPANKVVLEEYRNNLSRLSA